ncbi:MAG: hypothetical protein ABI467_29990 [Kofleriaceae bacterium]
MLFVLILVLLLVGACDSRAKASDPGVRSEQKSKEFESCGTSSHCADNLRCFANVCKRTARSTVGDYFAALGASQRARGDLETAISSYNQALGHYDSEKIALPPDIDCAYGAALAAAKGKKEHAELGARVLHRCLLAVPVGSALRDRALVDLATLSDAGLDPLALGRTSLADVYLTRSPTAPSTDKLAVTVVAAPAVTAKSFPTIADKLNETDPRSALVACWQAYNAATHNNTMSVTIPVSVKYNPSEYEDESGSYTTKIDPPSTLSPGAEASADACVRGVFEPAIKDLKTLHDAFSSRLTVTIK